MRAQNLTADSAILANLANQQKRGLPVGIAAGPELDDVAWSDIVACLDGSVPRAFKQRLEYVDFFGGEGEHPAMIPPHSSC
jgi:hypothetical protein